MEDLTTGLCIIMVERVLSVYLLLFDCIYFPLCFSLPVDDEYCLGYRIYSVMAQVYLDHNKLDISYRSVFLV